MIARKGISPVDCMPDVVLCADERPYGTPPKTDDPGTGVYQIVGELI